MTSRERSSGKRSSVAPSARSAASQKKIEAAEARMQIATLELEALEEIKKKKHQISLCNERRQNIEQLLKEFKGLNIDELPVHRQDDYRKFQEELSENKEFAGAVQNEIDDINKTLELQKKLINDRVKASAEIIDELDAENESRHVESDDESFRSTKQRTKDWVVSNNENNATTSTETTQVDHEKPKSNEWIRQTWDDGVIIETVLKTEDPLVAPPNTQQGEIYSIPIQTQPINETVPQVQVPHHPQMTFSDQYGHGAYDQPPRHQPGTGGHTERPIKPRGNGGYTEPLISQHAQGGFYDPPGHLYGNKGYTEPPLQQQPPLYQRQPINWNNHQYYSKEEPFSRPRRANGYTNLQPPLSSVGDYSPPSSVHSQKTTAVENKIVELMNNSMKLMDNQMKMMTTMTTNQPANENSAREILVKSNIDKDLPYFGGDPGQFMNFKAAYKRSSEKYKFDADMNMMRLHKALKGDAKKKVLHLMSNPQNIDKLMDTLEKNYGRPEFVLDYLVEKAKTCDKVQINKPESLVAFGDCVEALITNVCSYDKNEYMYNKQLTKELIEKLPYQLQDKWFEWRAECDTRETNLRYFSFWLEKRVNAARLRISPTVKMKADGDEETGKRKTKRGSATVNVASSEDVAKKDCACCKKTGHTTAKCRSFAKKTIEEKWTLVKQEKLCFLCLRSGHRTPECKSTNKCGVEGCEKPHHTFLHSQGRRPAQTSAVSENESGEDVNRVFKKTKKRNLKKSSQAVDSDSDGGEREENAATTATTIVEGTDGALPIVPVYIKGPKGIVKTHALLDTGASRSLIEEDLATELGLEGKSIEFKARGFGGHMTTMKNAKTVSLDISGYFRGAKFARMEKVVTVNKIGVAPYSLNIAEAKRKWPCLRQIKGKSMRSVIPRIIIGGTHRYLSIPKEILCSKKDGPVASRTRLGWVLKGDLDGNGSGAMYYLSGHIEELDSTLHKLIKESFKVDDFGIKPVVSLNSVEDKKALKIMDSTTVMKNGKWETGLLWRDENVILPESYPEALKRLVSTEKRMQKDSLFKQAYMDKIEEYKKKNYIIKIPEMDAKKPIKKKFYIPHFGVVNPNKPGKFRLVFDAAAKCHGSSLNDYLLTGPDLLRPLPTVLWNFRLHRYVISGDIEDMFHRVHIRQEDRPSQRFLWRDGDSSQPPDTYEMEVMIFGATSSPSSALYVKDKNAAAFKDEFIQAYQAITQDFYMDDCLTGGDDETDVARLREEITLINSKGGFLIKKWISNSVSIMKTIPKELQLQGFRNIGETEDATERILGLWWDPKEDYFTFKTNFHKVDPEILKGRIPTKREICRLVMSLFDPLGFIGHYRIKGMMVLQNVWRSGVGWDDEVSEDVYETWKVWLSDIDRITEVQVPRCYAWNLIDADRVELHTFVDASKEAYAAVSYLRIVMDNNICVSFVCSKVKVAPLKSLTIPRLELQGALLGAKLANTISSELRTQIHQKYFWSDSRTVLSWIKSETARLKEFVANRAGMIQELTNASDWNWISTKENVADDATRFSSKTEFLPESRWFTGPSFLGMVEDAWPEDKKEIEPDDLVISDVFKIGSSIDDGRRQITGDNDSLIPKVENFSSFTRLIRAAAAVRVATKIWISKIRVSNCSSTPPLWKKVPGPTHQNLLVSSITPDDMDEAEKRVIRHVQKMSGVSDWDLKKEKSLKSLCPYRDEDGIVRARGRIDLSKTPEDTRRPIILPSKHHVTNLIVDKEHRKNAHIGQETVLNNLRKKFWITHGRQAVRRCIARCNYCRLQRSKPVVPEMAILPSCRLASGHHPFFYTGIDYFGPMEVTVGRRHEKRWGVLLCFMVTRAVHIEVAHSLNSDETLLALSRFVDARRKPHTIFSDNGSNFHGAIKEMKKGISHESYRKTMEENGLQEIRWSFIPPAAAHMGGAWERLIQSVKKVIKNILHEKYPRDTVLLTILKGAENVVNSRPLTYLSSDSDDPDALTPNHFLKFGVDLGPSLPADIEEESKLFRAKWKEAQALINRFWAQWTNEFLPKLLERQKWTDQVEPLEVGDLVIIVDEQQPRNCWVKAVVTSTRPAKDGQVRDVEVTVRNFKTKKTTTYRRPVTKLCPLGLRIGKSSVMTPHLGVGNVEKPR